MTVYFVAMKANPAMVKIGSSKDMDRRLRAISVATPIILFATCDGDCVEERYFQKKFADLRVEGEWFKPNDGMLNFIAANTEPCHVEYGKSETRWTLRKPDGRKHLDGLVAHKLMQMVVSSYSRDITVGRALEKIYLSLEQLGEGWTRRRVRSLHEQAALRVDAYELIDLLKLSGMSEQEWIPWLRGDYHQAILEAAE